MGRGLQTVRGTRAGLDVSLTIGSKKASINGTSVTLAEAAAVRDGYTLVPLRFVSEASKALVLWDPYSRQVLVYSDAFFEENDIAKQDLLDKFEQYLEEQHKNSDSGSSGSGNSGGSSGSGDSSGSGGSGGSGGGNGGNDRMCSVWRYHPVYGGSLEWQPC